MGCIDILQMIDRKIIKKNVGNPAMGSRHEVPIKVYIQSV